MGGMNTILCANLCWRERSKAIDYPQMHELLYRSHCTCKLVCQARAGNDVFLHRQIDFASFVLANERLKNKAY